MTIEEAIPCSEVKYAKVDETVELTARLGWIEARRSDDRSTVMLPHSLGKKKVLALRPAKSRRKRRRPGPTRPAKWLKKIRQLDGFRRGRRQPDMMRAVGRWERCWARAA